MNQIAPRPIQICFVNGTTNFRWDFRLGRYLAERLPCFMAPTVREGGPAGLHWDAEQLGPLEPSDVQALRSLEQLAPPAAEFAPQETVKDAIIWLGNWTIETVRSQFPPHLVDVLGRWLRHQWARYVPQSVLDRQNWGDYFWQCISLPGNACLVIGGQGYGVLPCLAGYLEAHPAGLRAGHDGDINFEWRHEQIEERAAGLHPQDADRSYYAFTNFYTPAHLCDTLEYSFAERRPVLDPLTGWSKHEDGHHVMRYECIDDPPRFPVEAENGEGYLADLDGKLLLENYDPSVPHMLIHFHRGGYAARWLTQGYRGTHSLIEHTDQWYIRDQELCGSLAAQCISEAMPHFVYQALAMRLPPVLDSFRRQARNMVEVSGALPDPLWLRTEALRGTLDFARQERKPRRGNIDEMFYANALSPDHPQSNALSRALEWLESQQPQGDAPLAAMNGRVKGDRHVY